MEILKLLEQTEQADYLKQKTKDVKIYIIRNQLDD